MSIFKNFQKAQASKCQPSEIFKNVKIPKFRKPKFLKCPQSLPGKSNL